MNVKLILLLIPLWTVLSEVTIKDYYLKSLLIVSKYMSECLCMTGATETAANNLLLKLQYPNDPCLKYFVYCLYFKVGLINPDGTISKEALLALGTGLDSAVIDFCIDREKNQVDKSNKTFYFDQCLVQYVCGDGGKLCL